MDLEEVNNFEWLIDNCLLIESFRSGNKNEDEYVFWPWEVWHFVCVLLNIINNDHFRVLSSLLGFFTMFRRKKVVTNFSMLYTLDEDDWKNVREQKTTKLVLVKTTFLQILLWTSGQRRVSRQRYMLRTTTHAKYDKAKKSVLFFVLWSKALWCCLLLICVMVDVCASFESAGMECAEVHSASAELNLLTSCSIVVCILRSCDRH